MLRKIQLKNFKCFENVTIPLADLTLLAGLNGMGKSSVIQALLVIKQSFQQGLLPDRGLALNGELVNLGTAKDIMYEYAQNEDIVIMIYDQDDRNAKFRFRYNENADLLELISHGTVDFNNKCPIPENSQYLTAERIGPRVTFPLSYQYVRQQHQLGVRGEYTTYFLDSYATQPVLPGLKHAGEESNYLLPQTMAWMGEISPGTRLHISSHTNMDLVNLEYSFSTTRVATGKYRSSSVGFGLTYSLPILVALLSARPGGLVLLENPEAHLHPQGQARIGDLIARAAQSGVQVILETHSDHILNGIRVAVRQGRCSPDKVAIHYFSRKVKESTVQSQIVSPIIDKEGRFDQWPDGFFDEWEKSLENLF